MGRPKGSKNKIVSDTAGYERRLDVPLLPTDYERVKSAAARSNMTLAEFARRALDEAVKSVERFYYVRLTNGTYHPSLSEVGYEFFENAQRFAQRVGGQVVRETMQPGSDSRRDLPPAACRVDSGE